MTVAELIEILQQKPPNDIVIMATDSEGNYFSPLSQISLGVYVSQMTWWGNIYIRELDEEHIAAGFTEEDLCFDEEGRNAVVLWPVK